MLFKKNKMKLAGTLFVYNGEKFDYCYKEAIKCLLECTDYVIVVAGGEDDTYQQIMYIGVDEVIPISKEQWEAQKGREKLSYFTNIAINRAHELGYDYQFNLQADEILHENCYADLRKTIESNCDAYMITRVNLWQSPYLQLCVPKERMPCSSSIIRLARSCYHSFDDAESLLVPIVNNFYENWIRVYHMGFVRKREVMKSKIINMQEDVFQGSHDAKLDGSEIFNPKLWFNDDELMPIDEPLPKLIQKWAKERFVRD